jgi:hypothetical protein
MRTTTIGRRAARNAVAERGSTFVGNAALRHRLTLALAFRRPPFACAVSKASRFISLFDPPTSDEISAFTSFLLHTGDLTHLSDPAQFDTLDQLMKDCRTKNKGCILSAGRARSTMAVQYTRNYSRRGTGGYSRFTGQRPIFLLPARAIQLQQKKCSSIGSPPLATARAPYLAVMTHANRAAVFHLSLLQLNA